MQNETPGIPNSKVGGRNKNANEDRTKKTMCKMQIRLLKKKQSCCFFVTHIAHFFRALRNAKARMHSDVNVRIL